MQAFSSTVRDLYALAEYAAPDQFLTQAIGLLQSWIRFDGVLFGTGEGQQSGLSASLESAGVAPACTVPESILAKSSFSDDPVAHGFRHAPSAPARGGIRELYRRGKTPNTSRKTKELTGPRNLAEELGLCHLMVHGDDPTHAKPARWIVLYRRNDVRFAQTDAACLHGLWTHLSRAIGINRTRSLERHSKKNDGAVTGLISMLRQHGFNMCRIRPIDALEVLTPREFVVARRFAAGMSHKHCAMSAPTGTPSRW